MAYVGSESNVMRPKMGDLTISLPVTFDYTGGRKESNKQKRIWAVIISFVSIIIGFIIMFHKDGDLLIDIALGLLFWFVVSLVLRFFFFGESKIKKYYEEIDKTDMEKSFTDAWGIYTVDDVYPYFVRYRNGRVGVFIKLNKDVILGKYSESEFHHYEAIGDAYNIAGSGNISMCHVDYMDNVGSDERLLDSFADLEEVANTDVKEVLTDMFSYLQVQMNTRVTTFDLYVFTFTGSEIAAWNNIQRILSCLLDGNYVSYYVMNRSDLGDLFKTLFNVHEFSVSDAMLNTFDEAEGIGVTPIKVEYSDGRVEILNKTTEEKSEEQRIRNDEKAASEAYKKLKKQEKKNKRNKKRKDTDIDDDEDLF